MKQKWEAIQPIELTDGEEKKLSWEIRYERNGYWYTVADVYLTPDASMEDNAKLIAASPDLLEALKTALDFIEAEGEYGDLELDSIRDKLMKDTQAAIAKATE